MPLPLTTKVKIPDSVYVPMIMMQTGINQGKLITSCQLTLAAAKGTDPGTDKENWEATGQSSTIYIYDLVNLDPGYEQFGDQVKRIYGDILILIAAINEVKKVL